MILECIPFGLPEILADGMVTLPYERLPNIIVFESRYISIPKLSTDEDNILGLAVKQLAPRPHYLAILQINNHTPSTVCHMCAVRK